MKLPALLCSDLHLTASPRDEYRWGLFKWLMETMLREEAQTLVILGDLTDAKDYHPSSLVNRLVGSVAALTWLGVDVWALMGNHDYLRRGHAYFEFLSHIPRVRFATRPMEIEDDGKGPTAIMLPHSKDPVGEWQGLDLSHFDLCFMHQTFSGAVAGNGQVLQGDKMPWLQARKLWSGDIHVPQQVRHEGVAVEYVGSPYPVHFGDDFEPRCVLLDRRARPSDLHFPTIRRLALRVSGSDELAGVCAVKARPGDQAKVTVELPQHEMHEWRRVQRECMAVLREHRLDVHELRLQSPPGASSPQGGAKAVSRGYAGLSDEGAVLAFVEARELGGDAYDAGLETMR